MCREPASLDFSGQDDGNGRSVFKDTGRELRQLMMEKAAEQTQNAPKVQKQSEEDDARVAAEAPPSHRRRARTAYQWLRQVPHRRRP